MKRALSVICLAGLTLMACKKDKPGPDPEPDPDPVNVIGFWEGNYVDAKNGNKEGYFAFELKADSSATVYIDKKNAAEPGSKENAKGIVATTFKHSQTTKKVTFVYAYGTSGPAIDLATSGTVNDAVTAITDGTWGDSPSITDRGTYTVTKK